MTARFHAQQRGWTLKRVLSKASRGVVGFAVYVQRGAKESFSFLSWSVFLCLSVFVGVIAKLN